MLAQASVPIAPFVVLVLCVIAGIGTVLLLPSRREPSIRKIGGAILLAAGLILAALLLRWTGGDARGGMGVYFWVFAIIAIFGALVYRESPGPIFYKQRRLGRDGRPFWCYKIRSMRLDAEAAGQVGWTKADDPRRLAIGAFMRKWNIDETPQFWNVLKGDMSLVGPRPERPELIHNFKEEIPHYNARHNIKPGITGWAQINGYRGDTDLNARIRCDLYYIENWNLMIDFQIMLLTLFRQKNAC